MNRLSLSILLALLPACLLSAAEITLEQALVHARNLELAPMAERPDWVPDTEPLFRLGWFSDLHLIDKESIQRTTLACHQLRDEIRPLAVILTGDNCGLPSEALPGHPEGDELDLARQQWLHDFLKRELSLPCLAVPGDNWPWRFTEVLGPDKRSFDFAGLHFIFLGMDEQARGGPDGCQLIRPETLDWLADDLRRCAPRPAIFIMHEPVYPPTFLDANQLAELFDETPNFLLALGGHLHLDLQFGRKHWHQWCAPSIGRSHRPAFKVMDFHHDCIIMTSYELTADGERFAQAPKWQLAALPPSFRLAETPPKAFLPENLRLAPHQGREDNPELAKRHSELGPALFKAFLGNRQSRAPKKPTETTQQ